MRNLPEKALQEQGLAPYNTVEIVGIGEFKDLVEISTIDNGIAGNNLSSTVTIKLIGDTIKQLFNNVDLHKKTVYIHQKFKGFDEVSFIVFQGLINTPIIYTERELCVQFDVLNQIESNEVGFSIEEGQFAIVPQDLIGKAWPWIFGTVIGSPCLQVNKVPQGTTTASTEIASNNVTKNQASLNKAKSSANSQITNLQQRRYELSTYRFELQAQLGIERSNVLNRNQAYITQLENAINSIDTQLESIEEQIREQNSNVQQMNAYSTAVKPANERSSIPIVTNSLTPDGVALQALIGGYIHSGVIQGGVFVVTARQEVQGIESVGLTSVDFNNSGTLFKTSVSSPLNVFIPGGSRFSLLSYPVRYVVSLLACTNVRLESQRTLNGVTFRALIPTNYYSITVENFNGLVVTMATFPKPLSSYHNEGWNDTVFANATGAVGPNAVTILQYLIANYTHFDVDATSFDFVATQLAAFPCAFTLTNKEDIIKLLQDIAYQSRCVLWLVGNTFYIKYLSYPYAPVDTIVKDDIFNLSIESTSTENIITVYSALWGSRHDDQYKVIFRNNVAKYGVHKGEDNYYIFNDLSVVEHSALFWLIRKSNMWKKVKFSTPQTKLNLEVYDSVQLDFGNQLISNSPVVGYIEEAKYQPDSNTINFVVWIPVRFGEMEPYVYATPAQISFLFDEKDSGSNNTTNSKAKGNLVNPTQTYGNNVGKFNSRTNRDRGHIHVGDTGFTPGGNPDFYVQLANVDVGEPSTPSTNTAVQAIVNKSNLGEFPTFATVPGTFVGKIIEKLTDTTYNIDVYFGSTQKPPTITEMVVFGLNSDEEVPANLPCIVFQQVNYQTIGKNTFGQTVYAAFVPFFGLREVEG